MGKKKNKTTWDSDFDLGLDEIGIKDNEAEVSSVAREIRDRIKRGATVDDISWYKANTLKATLSFFRVSGRSKLTYKEDMAERLIEVFGDATEEKHGKASLNIEEKLKQRAEMDRLILRNISRRGGL